MSTFASLPAPNDPTWAQTYERRRAAAIKAMEDELAGVATHCQPWCAGPAPVDLVRGTHTCPPELTPEDVDELQIESLTELLRAIRLIVGDRCVIHGEDNVIDAHCTWCRVVQLVKDVEP